jgi:hypothetical protein
MKKPSLKTLRRKADKIFSQYIRQRDFGVCCTCGKLFNWKEGDAGHYINRIHLGTRFDEHNCHFQCVACNRYRKPMAAYAAFMYNKYGADIINELLKQSHWTLIEFAQTFYNKGVNTFLNTRWAYELVIEHYTKKLEGLK